MKNISKVNKLISVLTAVSMLVPQAFASWNMGEVSPYTYGPEGRPVENLDQANYGKPTEMVSIVPGRPVAARDKDGNRLYYNPSGALSMKMTTDGKMQFSLVSINQTTTYNEKGDLESQTQFVKGTNKSITKDSKGNITSYNELGYGGQVVKQYDLAIKDEKGNYVTAKDVLAKAINKQDIGAPSFNNGNADNLTREYNVTKEYSFDKYGKSPAQVTDQLTQSKTIFGSNGLPVSDINSEGQKTAEYTYDDKNKLVSKKDQFANITYFDKEGKMTYSENREGTVVLKYNYKSDSKGNTVLDTSVDMNGNVTTYANGKPQVEKSPEGKALNEWVYDQSGQTLLYTFEDATKTVSWYDISGRQLYNTVDNNIVKEWVYDQGKLAGVWDNTDNTFAMYSNGVQVKTVALDKKPEVTDIEKWNNEGVVSKKYVQPN